MNEHALQKIGRTNGSICTLTAAGTVASTAVFALALFAAVAPTCRAQAASENSASAPTQSAGITLTLNAPPDPVEPGTSFQVPVTLSGTGEIVSFTVVFEYDATKLMLTSITPGDVLNRDGKSAPIIHSDSPAGHVVISMARPPGSPGIEGDGTVCVLTFQANAPGAGELTITRAFVVDRGQQMHPARFAPAHIVVRR